MKITLQDLEQNIKTLPESFYGQVNNFIDFLKTKYDGDWSGMLSEPQRKSLKKGLDDIENDRTMSHESAQKKIKNYIASKK